MSKVEYRFLIGPKTYSLSIEAEENADGASIFSADDLLKEQLKLGLKFVEDIHDAEGVECDLFNFLVDITGMTNSEIASYIGIEPATISQWRRNKGISKAAWQTFRIFFYDLFTHGSVTNPIFISNKRKKAS